jgi:hypothetical protein
MPMQAATCLNFDTNAINAEKGRRMGRKEGRDGSRAIETSPRREGEGAEG